MEAEKNSSRSSSSSFDESTNLHVNALLQRGLSSSEIVLAWLREFSFEQYAQNFLQNGYDIQTIVRMTPEVCWTKFTRKNRRNYFPHSFSKDLTAIGITHPLHRRKIKNEITRLNLPDNLPNFKPETLAEWLSYLNLDEYLARLEEQNYKNLDEIKDIVWEDLEDIGILLLGHQKRFMLAVKRLIEIDKGIYSSKMLTSQWHPSDNDEAFTK